MKSIQRRLGERDLNDQTEKGGGGGGRGVARYLRMLKGKRIITRHIIPHLPEYLGIQGGTRKDSSYLYRRLS